MTIQKLIQEIKACLDDYLNDLSGIFKENIKLEEICDYQKRKELCDYFLERIIGFIEGLLFSKGCNYELTYTDAHTEYSDVFYYYAHISLSLKESNENVNVQVDIEFDYVDKEIRVSKFEIS